MDSSRAGKNVALMAALVACALVVVFISRSCLLDAEIERKVVELNAPPHRRLLPYGEGKAVLFPTNSIEWNQLPASERNSLSNVMSRIPDIDGEVERIDMAFPGHVVAAKFWTRRNCVYFTKDEGGNWHSIGVTYASRTR